MESSSSTSTHTDSTSVNMDLEHGTSAASAASTASTASPQQQQLDRSQVPPLMRQASVKRIINQRPANTPTKNFRMKSLLWVKPQITSRQLSNSSIMAQVRSRSRVLRDSLTLGCTLLEQLAELFCRSAG